MIPLGVLGASREAAAGGGGSLTLAFGSSLANDENTATYTFSNMDIGTATATRHVVAVVAIRATSAIVSPSVTIGGTPATIDAHVGGADNNAYTAIIAARAAVPAGTTATVVCTGTYSGVRAGCATYMLTGGTPAVAGLATSTTKGAVTLTPTPDTSAALIAAVHQSQTAAVTIANVTTNTDILLENVTRFATGMATDAPTSVEVTTGSSGGNWWPPSFAIAYEPA